MRDFLGQFKNFSRVFHRLLWVCVWPTSRLHNRGLTVPGLDHHLHTISGSTRLLVLDHQLGLCGISLTHPLVLQLPSYLKQGSYVDIVFQWWHCACAVVLTLRLRSLASFIAFVLVTVVLQTNNFDLISTSILPHCKSPFLRPLIICGKQNRDSIFSSAGLDGLSALCLNSGVF